MSLRDPLAARAHRRLPQRSAAGGVGRQSEPAARAASRTLQEIYDESMAQTLFALVILGIAAS